jgi:hypothetical protein
MLKLDVFQKKLLNKGQKMTIFPLSTGENIIIEKVESITDVDNKIGFKGSLYEFTIHMDSGREISITDDDNLILIKEQEALLKAIKKA